MDDSNMPSEAAALPLPGTPQPLCRSLDAPAGFVPLRLVLQPSGRLTEITQPDVTVGRHSTSDVCLRLPDISRRHCRFVFSDNHWHVFDLQSLNGVFVNGVRIDRAQLRQRDTIRIGSLLFEVDLLVGPPTVQLPANGPRTAGERILETIYDALPKDSPGGPPQRLAS